MSRYLLLFIALVPALVFGQSSISGKVVNQADGKPIPFATVFISNATIAANTGDDGSFILKGIKPGTYQLSVSFIGFAPSSQLVTLSGKDVKLSPISLQPSGINLAEVTVKANNDPDRQDNVKWFTDEFLGSGALAAQAKITNPEVLDLTYKKGVLTGSSVDFLNIQNNALGYRLKYLLQDFMLNRGDDDKRFAYSGMVHFEKLTGTPLQEKEWVAARQKLYEGSMQHWLRSLIAGNLAQQGFKVMLVPRNVARPSQYTIDSKIEEFTDSKEKGAKDSLKYWKKIADMPAIADKLAPDTLKVKDYLTGPDASGIYILDGTKGSLFVIYDKTHYFSNTTLTRFRDNKTSDIALVNFTADKVFFDKNGVLVNPTDINIEGVWTKKRVAALLPLDYEPVNDENTITDSTQLKRIAASLTNYTNGDRLERAYMHFDKPYYAAGDTIYYKTYVTTGAEHTLSAVSNIVYVDITDPAGKLIKQETLPLLDGMAWGDFALPEKSVPGAYRVRAYTLWMRNHPEDVFYQDVTVATRAMMAANGTAATKSAAIVDAKANSSAKADIQFLPEGGALLAGESNTVGVKVVSPGGMGAAVKQVAIADDKGKQVAMVNNFHLGMASFTFKPDDGHTYTGTVTFSNGNTQTQALPAPVKTGILMHVDAITDTAEINIKIAQVKTTYEQALNLIGTSGGRIYYAARIIPGVAFNKSIARNSFPTGVVRFTLFNAAGEPLNERLVFIDNHDGLQFNIAQQGQAHGVRTAEDMAIEVKNTNGHPVSGGFSVTVTNLSTVPVAPAQEHTILSDMLLRADLAGNVEQPNYYFTANDNRALDNLMLTQGYRSFVWKTVLGKPVTYDFAPEKSMSLSGIIKSYGGKPLVNTKVKLIYLGGLSITRDTVTDDKGRFVFLDSPFPDGTRFIIKPVKHDTNPAVVTLDSIPGLAPVAANQGQANEFLANIKQYMAGNDEFLAEKKKNGWGNGDGNRVLAEVSVKADKKEPRTATQNLNGSGGADQVITAADLEKLGCVSLYECLVSKLSGVKIARGKFYSLRSMINAFPDPGGDIRDPMQIVIDGNFGSSPDDNYGMLYTTIKPGDVKSIEVIKGLAYGAAYGSRGANGLILINLKNGKDFNVDAGPGIKKLSPQGFYRARAFYMPQYNADNQNTLMRDLRNTIYWNPDIITGADGKATINYFNADTKGIYRLVIEGIDVNGNLGHYEYKYEVK